ncbi:MAG: prepilin-type N-terminal cleavage/methylation domain-containing protein [Proteobacteria bacterium]|nr:prepilin-type N-terminal cleavage/methylation domain-containing protein [Pseudomonadota bacterium]MBU1688075.1 prepilin-type N-terminal cleavage/methylation domain-containing protein [Pseudomonadota bacterium]
MWNSLRESSAQRGFTLLELIITMIILGFASLIMIPFITAIGHSPDPVIRQRAVALGQAMMDEITSKKWDENTPLGGGPIGPTTESARGTVIAPSLIGPDGAETRATFDDVDDYDGLTATDIFQNQDGVTFTLNGYNRTVIVSYIASNANPISALSPVGTTTAATATDTKRIVVRVTTLTQETLEFIALSCNY